MACGARLDGRIQYSVANEQPPHLDAIAPLVSADGFSYDIFYYGGVLKKGYVDMLGVVGFGAQRKVRSHPIDNEFWQNVKQKTRHTDRIRVPVLMLTSWYDLSADTVIEGFTEFQRHGTSVTRDNSKLWIGPWQHVAIGKLRQGELEFPEAEGVGATVSTRFFDHYLRGLENGWQKESAVTYLRMGHNEWFATDEFPPATEGMTSLYLADQGLLKAKSSSESDASAAFDFDPDDPSPTLGGMNAFIGVDPNYKKWEPVRVISGPLKSETTAWSSHLTC